jgi:hypothetical protein
MRFLKFLLFLLTTPALAQGVHHFDTVLVRGNNVAANVVPEAKIRVCVTGTGCSTLAPIFNDIALTQPLANPVTADGSGSYSYYSAAGCVDEQFSSPNMGTVLRRNVCLPNGVAGASFPSTSNVVVNTSTSTSRNARRHRGGSQEECAVASSGFARLSKPIRPRSSISRTSLDSSQLSGFFRARTVRGVGRGARDSCRPENGRGRMSDELDNLTPAQIRRLIRAKSGPPRQRLNQATQDAIDATLTNGILCSEIANEEDPPEILNDYFNFRG